MLCFSQSRRILDLWIWARSLAESSWPVSPIAFRLPKQTRMKAAIRNVFSLCGAVVQVCGFHVDEWQAMGDIVDIVKISSHGMYLTHGFIAGSY